MIFCHNFDLGSFSLHKDNGDGTAFFYKDESYDISEKYSWKLDYRLYYWNHMRTSDGFNLKFCDISKRVVLQKPMAYMAYDLSSNETIYYPERIPMSQSKLNRKT